VRIGENPGSVSKLRVAFLVALALLALLAVAFELGLLPQRYDARDQLAGISVFWNEDEAFVFVAETADGHRHNWLTDHAPGLWRAVLMSFGLEEWRLFGQSTKAYHLAGGRLEAYTLDQTPMFPAWDLEDGKLAARPRFGGPDEPAQGFRWTGSGFERVSVVAAPGATGPQARPRELKAEDEDDPQDERELGPLSGAAKEKLKSAGWHFKTLSGYEGIQDPAELPIDLRDDGYRLSLQAARVEPQSDLGLPMKVSVSLSGKRLQPPSQALFAGGDWREVGREEFDRLSARSPYARAAPRSGGPLTEVAGHLVPIGCAVLAVWLMWKGPTRGLKIALAVFVVAWIAPMVATGGWGRALPLLVIPPVMGIVSMMASTRLVRYRVKRTLVAVGEDSCPSYALPRVRELTAALEAMGFRFHADRQSTWQMMAKDRRTFIRYFGHASRHVWAEVQATDEPKSVGRMLCSVKGGTTILTGDLQANQELLRDPQTLFQRVPRATSCADMLMAHETFAMKTAGTARTIDDPVAADVEAYERWVQALLRSKQVAANGDWFKISPRAVVPITLRIIGAWFH